MCSCAWAAQRQLISEWTDKKLSDASAKSLSTAAVTPFRIELLGLTDVSVEALVWLAAHPKAVFPAKFYSDLSKPHKLKSVTIVDATLLASRVVGALNLNGLVSLSDPAAQALAQHKGGGLALNGLTALSDEAILSLAQHKGDLYLNGLTRISDDAAAGLASHQGDLSLSGLKQISSQAWVSLRTHAAGKVILSPTLKSE